MPVATNGMVILMSAAVASVAVIVAVPEASATVELLFNALLAP